MRILAAFRLRARKPSWPHLRYLGVGGGLMDVNGNAGFMEYELNLYEWDMVRLKIKIVELNDSVDFCCYC